MGGMVYKRIFKYIYCTAFYLTLILEHFVSFGFVLVFFSLLFLQLPTQDFFVDGFNYYLETSRIFRLEHNTVSPIFTICRTQHR